MVEKHSELSPFAGQITCFGACSKARGQPRHLRSEPKKVSRFQRLYDLGPCLLTKETCKQVLLQFPHITLQREGPITKGELAQDHGPWFQTWLWHPSSRDTRACILDFGTIPRSPCTTISATVLVFPVGCLKYLGTEQVKGVSKNKEILNPKTLCISQKLGARKRPSELPHQHAAVHHTCSLVERALELNESDLACLARIQ